MLPLRKNNPILSWNCPFPTTHKGIIIMTLKDFGLGGKAHSKVILTMNINFKLMKAYPVIFERP